MAAAALLPTCPFVVQSVHHVSLIATFLTIDELMQSSSLCRHLHLLFDGQAIWLDRLRKAEPLQRVADVDLPPMPAGALLSAEALAALPPLPSLSEAAILCWQASPRCTAERRLAVFVHVPSTLHCHARRIQVYDHDDGGPEWRADHSTFFLKYDGDKQQWAVASRRDNWGNGWMAHNIADNVVEDEAHSDDASRFTVVPPTTIVSNGTSSKQRYIDVHKCSEHEHNGCYQLLQPLPPRHVTRAVLEGNVPPICFIPLCATCRTAIAGCVARNGIGNFARCDDVWSLVRVNSTDYDVAMLDYLVRVRIAYECTSAAAEGKKKKTWWERIQRDDCRRWGRRWVCDVDEVDNYTVVAHYGQRSGMFTAHHENVCLGCQSGVTPSGKGHTEQCREGRKRQRR